MALTMAIKRCKIFDEFTKEEQEQYFAYNDKKVVHNIDTLYFTVYLDEENHIDTITSVINDLEKHKQLSITENEDQSFNDNLLISSFGSKMFSYRLSLPNVFDIFICKNLISTKNPRIIVQLRSLGLWQNDTKELIFKATEQIKDIFNVPILEINENRLDFCYHINTIQDTTNMFSDKKLKAHLKTNFKIYTKVGEIGREITIDYLSLGSRRSNNVFFRAYNKTREVIEMNYKGFFIHHWFENKLISSYDKYCLEYAYINKSYNHLHIGRLLWYLENGKNEDLKLHLRQLYEVYITNSDNFEFIIKHLDKVLPPVTIVTNIEFQTKRKFFETFKMDELYSPYKKDDVYKRLFDIIEHRKTFLKYLTCDLVSFKKGESYCNWWARIVSCKIENTFLCADIEREYARVLDKKKIEKNIIKSIATYSIYANKVNEQSFNDDVIDYLSTLNDNDIGSFVDSNTGEVLEFHVRNVNYDKLKSKKLKQLKSIIE